MRLGVTRHEQGLLGDQAAIAGVGVGEDVRVGRRAGRHARSAGHGESVRTRVDAGDVHVPRACAGQTPDGHAHCEAGGAADWGTYGGAAGDGGEARQTEQRVIGALAEGSVIDDDAAGAETAGRIEIDGRGIDDRAAGVDVRTGEGQRRVRLTAIGAGDDEPDGAGDAVIDDIGGEEAAAAIVFEGRVPDVEIGGRANDAGGQVTVADGQEAVAVVLPHDEAAIAQTEGVAL